MAIRKISELPLINPLDTSIRGRLKNSFIELSLSDKDTQEESYTFTSKKVRYEDIENSIIQHISGTPRDTVDIQFYTKANFMEPINMYDGLKISGDVYINENVDDVSTYELSVNMGYIILQSPTINLHAQKANNVTDIILSDDKVQVLNTQSGTQNELVNIQSSKTTISTDTDIGGDLTTKNIIINQDGSLLCRGNATFDNIINGTALYAKWADLAEMYDSDFGYEPGTLVKFGGDKEITIADDTVNAVITTKPGLLLGEKDTDSKLPIALVGKVPVKVIGNVKKFDKLVLSDKPGIASVKSDEDVDKAVIGIALESIECNNTDINLVNSVVQLKF